MESERECGKRDNKREERRKMNDCEKKNERRVGGVEENLDTDERFKE